MLSIERKCVDSHKVMLYACLLQMSLRNWIHSLKSLPNRRWSQWDSFRPMSTLLPYATSPSDELSNLPSNLSSNLPSNLSSNLSSSSSSTFPSPGTLTHATSAKVKFLGVFIGFVDDAKRKRQQDKALEKRRRVIHRLRQLQKQREESWQKEVEHLAFNAFTRAYRKTLNTLRSGSKAKQAIFDKASELGTKSALTLTDHHPLMTKDDLKKLLEQEEDHFGRLGWEYLPISVKTAYENLLLSINAACEELKAQIAESRPSKPSSNRAFSDTEIALRSLHMASSEDEPTDPDSADLNLSLENVMDRIADPEALSAAYDRIKLKLRLLSGKSSEDWNDLNMSFFDQIAFKLRTGTYQFSPVSHIFVRKPGKDETRRAIVVVNPKDQVVAEAVRAELERIYEPVFYKLARSCHMALKLVKRTWKGTTWFIHYKSPIAFGKSHHEILLHVLSARVKDDEFLCLIQQMLKSSVVNLGDRGSRLSALLCNIYYHQLDMEVTRIQAELNTGSNKRKVKSSAQFDEDMGVLVNHPGSYARVRYVRYAEEFLFGITGSKAMALEVLQRVQIFLGH